MADGTDADLDGEAESSPRIAFRVPQRVKEELEAIASVEGKTFSEVSREAMESYLTHRRSA
jgi:predicted DNA-binding protein